MHVVTRRPACWTENPEPRCGWAWDRGAACGNASTPEDVHRLLDHTPGCSHCARLRRGVALFEGGATAHTPDLRGQHRSVG